MSKIKEALAARAALSSVRAAIEKAKGGGHWNGQPRFPAGSSKGGQFAPKGGASGGGSSKSPFSGLKSLLDELTGGSSYGAAGYGGSGYVKHPYTPPPPPPPPPGAKPHPRKDDKGQPVTINYPTKPSGKETWADHTKTATFVPGGETPKVLNGVEFKSYTPPKDWSKVTGTNEALEKGNPFTPTRGKSIGSGVVIMEPDGRVWLTKPTNEFGGYKNTYPKGTLEDGLTLQQSAIKETWEETGLKALCSDFQNTFYGKNPNFIASAWHREDQLGEALVNGAGMGGETGDAVERLAAKIISDYLAFYLPFEAGEIDDEQVQFGIEGVVEFYTHVLLGLPYEAD